MAIITKVGGIGIPVIDAYVPSKKILEAGLEVFKGDEHKTEVMQRAIQARERIYDYVEAHGGLRRGAKADIKQDEYPALKPLVDDFVDASRLLREHFKVSETLPPEARADMLRRIQVKHLGGTVTNKLNGFKAGRGDNIDAVIVGVTGRDENGVYVIERLKERGITLLDNGVRCSQTPLNYVITEDRAGNALGDRHILKGVSNAAEVLANNQDYILQQVAKLNLLFLEGGDISRIKFGHELFGNVVDTAVTHNLDLAYAPPTNKGVALENPGGINKAILAKAGSYKRNDMPTCFNVEELLANYLPDHVKLPEGHTVTDSDSDPYVQLAMNRLKLELADRREGMPHTNNQPIAIVSDGKRGAYIMTHKPEQTIFVQSTNGIDVMDTTGAGDNLAAGAFIKAVQLANAHRDMGTGQMQELTDDELVSIARFAQKMAALAVQKLGACVERDDVIKLMMENAPPPLVANLEGVRKLGATKEVAHGV